MAKRHDPPPSAADESPTPKRLMASAAPSEKVCVICRHFFGLGDFIFSIYVLDLEFKSAKDSDVQWLEPIIRMDRSCPLDMAPAVWNSKLYMFGGLCLRKKEDLNWEEDMYTWEKDMYTWDLSEFSPTTMLIDNKSLSLMKGKQRMNGAKTKPFAAIVEGKICVFSSTIDGMRYHDLEYQNFEIFDPVNESWTKLPELPELRRDSYKVESYCVQNSNLFLSTNHGIYSIDVKQPTAWIFLDMCLGVLKFPSHGSTSHGMAVVMDHVYFTPHFAYLGFAEPKTPLTFLLKGFLPTTLSCLLKYDDDDDDNDDDNDDNEEEEEPLLVRRNGCITCLGGNRICTMMAGFDLKVEVESYPYLVVDAFNFNAKYDASSSELREQMQCLHPAVAVPEIAKLLCSGFSAIKSSKYVLTGDRCEMVDLKCFPI